MVEGEIVDNILEEPVSTSMQILKNVHALANLAIQHGRTKPNGHGQTMWELNSDEDVSQGYTVSVTFNRKRKIEFIDVRKNGPPKESDSETKYSREISLRLSPNHEVTLIIDRHRVNPLPKLDYPKPSSLSGLFDTLDDVRVIGQIEQIGDNTQNYILNFTQDAFAGISKFSSNTSTKITHGKICSSEIN